MLHLQSRIEIATTIAEAFRLLADAECKARLNPDIEVLKISQVTDGPIGMGTRTFFSLRTDTGIRNFHCEVVDFEPNRYIEWLSDTQPAFRVRQSLELTATGCLLVHDEWLDEQPITTSLESRGVLFDIADAFQLAASMDISPAPAHAANPAEDLRIHMQERLAVWLANIKSHLEVPEGQDAFDFTQEIVVGF